MKDTPSVREDRRVKYTKALLKEALVELMQTQHISKITVKELCARADVHRTTFYAHYTDPNDLLHQLSDEIIGTIGQSLSEQQTEPHGMISLEQLSKILQYVRSNADLFGVILSKNSDIAIHQDVLQFLDLSVYYPTPPVEGWQKTYFSLFCIHGCVSILNRWMQDGFVQSTEEIAAFIMQLINRGLQSFGEKA